jgi:hypothetical protein
MAVSGMPMPGREEGGQKEERGRHWSTENVRDRGDRETKKLRANREMIRETQTEGAERDKSEAGNKNYMRS